MRLPPEPGRAVAVTGELAERLAVFELLVRRWTQRINLVSRHDLADLRRRHIEDSLQLVDLLPSHGRIVDLGSGAGFPGLIVGLATGRPVTLIEADTRKASFLREAARATGTAADVRAVRIEHAGITDAGIVLARALAPLPQLLGLAQPLMRPGAMALFLKGARVADELAAAAVAWRFALARHPSRTTSDGCILEISGLAPVPA